VRLLPESGQVLLAAAILSASIIVRPAQPVIANPSPELPTVELQLTLTDLQPAVVNITQDPAVVEVTVVNPAPSVPNGEPVSIVVQPAPVLPAEIIYEDRIVEVVVEVVVVCNPAIQPDRRAVVLTNGVVTNIMAGSPGQQFTDFVEGNPNYGEITCLPVQPQVGWLYDGQVFTPPA